MSYQNKLWCIAHAIRLSVAYIYALYYSTCVHEVCADYICMDVGFATAYFSPYKVSTTLLSKLSI